MHTKLIFRGQPLSVPEMIERLRREFAFVSVDADEGLASARRMADLWDRPPPLLGKPDHVKATALRALPHGSVVVVRFGDSPTRKITTTFWPDEPPFFGSNPDDDETAAEELIDRCASALECTELKG